MRPLEFLVSGSRPRGRRVLAIALVVITVVLALLPYLRWARDPSLFDDDLTRVGAFRRSTLATSLFRPFNEHVAPLFELVGWFAWWGCGRRVEVVGQGFLLASYLAWLATIATLGSLVRLELRSTLAGMVAAAWFAQTSVAAETVLWYSASSFQWAAAGSLASCYAATRALRSGSGRSRVAWLASSALCAASSPLFSAIGALAGPLASLRLVVGEGGGPWRLAAIRRASAPLVGTVAYGLLLAANPYLGAEVSASLGQHMDLAAALSAAGRAPSLALLPIMMGLPSGVGSIADIPALLLTLGLLGGVIGWAWRSRDRGLLLVGLGFVVGGYLLAYAARARPGDRWIFEVSRYHLFPAIGVTCWVATGLGRILERVEACRPLTGLAGVALVAAAGLALQGPKVDEIVLKWYRYPEQGRSLAAGVRLEAACRAELVPLAQASRIIDPTEPRWFPRPLPFHPLIYLFEDISSGEHRGDPEARSAVLGSLRLDDREAIFGGLDAARYRGPGGQALPIALEPASSGSSSRVGEGRMYHHEFVGPPGSAEVVSFDLVGVTPGARVEVWWAGDDAAWSSGRSVRWTAAAGFPLRVADLPHWGPVMARRFRVVRRGWPLPATDHPVLKIGTREGAGFRPPVPQTGGSGNPTTP